MVAPGRLFGIILPMDTDRSYGALHGPINRYLVRAVRWFMYGNGQTFGGVLGCDYQSPRLKGWLEELGISPEGLERLIEAARNWKTASPTDLRQEASHRRKETTRETRHAMRSLFRAIHAAGRPVAYDEHSRRELMISKAYLIQQAMEYLSDPDPELEQGRIAQQLLDSGFDPTSLPSQKTMADEQHWFGGMSVEEMIDIPHAGSGTE
jgi:hypothetical protein